MNHHAPIILSGVAIMLLGVSNIMSVVSGSEQCARVDRLERQVRTLETRKVATGYDADGKLVFEPQVTIVEIERKP